MKKKVLSTLLLIAGTLLLLNNLAITGAVVGISSLKRETNILALILIGMGMLILNQRDVSGLEKELNNQGGIRKQMPGKGIKGDYIALSDILRAGKIISNKISVEVKRNQLYRDGRPVQGLTLHGDYIEFTGCHFTSSEAARIIEQDSALQIKNQLDPYVYLLEPMDYSGKKENEVRHMIGSASAEECISVRVKYPINKVFIKVEKGRPTHYAIDGDIETENLVVKKGEYISRRRLEDL